MSLDLLNFGENIKCLMLRYNKNMIFCFSPLIYFFSYYLVYNLRLVINVATVNNKKSKEIKAIAGVMFFINMNNQCFNKRKFISFELNS